MTHGNALEESCESSRKGGNCVALYQKEIRAFSHQHRTQARQNARGQAVQVLIVMHDGEVMIGADAEKIEYLVQQFTMLAGDANTYIEVRRHPRRPYDGCHFNGLRSGAEDEEYLHKDRFRFIVPGNTDVSQWDTGGL